MKKRVKVTETYTYYIDVDVDSTDEMEIAAAIDNMDCEDEIDWDDFDDYEREIEIMKD